MQYTVKSAPEGWTDDYTTSLIDGLMAICSPRGSGKFSSDILEPDTFLSGKSDHAYAGILPVFPSDYDGIREKGYMVTLKLCRVSRVGSVIAGEDWVQNELPPEKLDPKHPEYDYVRYFNTFSDIRNVVYEKQTIAEFDLSML